MCIRPKVRSWRYNKQCIQRFSELDKSIIISKKNLKIIKSSNYFDHFQSLEHKAHS